MLLSLSKKSFIYQIVILHYAENLKSKSVWILFSGNLLSGKREKLIIIIQNLVVWESLLCLMHIEYFKIFRKCLEIKINIFEWKVISRMQI